MTSKTNLGSSSQWGWNHQPTIDRPSECPSPDKVGRLADYSQALQCGSTKDGCAAEGKIQIPMFAELGIAPATEALSPEPVEPMSQLDPLSWEWVSVDEACRLFGLSRIGLFRLLQVPSERHAPTTAEETLPSLD
jgi:hypothetical protein